MTTPAANVPPADTDPTRVAAPRPGSRGLCVPPPQAPGEPTQTAVAPTALTEAEVAATRPDPRGPRWIRDRGADRIPGLRLRVGTNGSRVWYIGYRPESGRHCTAALGSWPTVSLAHARVLAAGVRDAVRRARLSGTDDGPTFAEVAEQLWLEAFFDPRAPRRGRAVRRRLDQRILPAFGHRPLGWLTATDLTEWYEALAAENSREADLALGLVSHVFNHAREHGLTERNPCRQVRRRDRTARHRRPLFEELRRLRLAIVCARRDTDPTLLVALATVIAAGQSERDILRMRWSDIDFDARSVAVPLARDCSREIDVDPEILAALFSLPRRNAFVFHNPRTGQPYTTVHTLWNRLRAAADGDHLWLSDLSHHYRVSGEPELKRVVRALLVRGV